MHIECFQSPEKVIHVTVTPMLNGRISAADFAVEHEEKTTAFKSSVTVAG